MRLRAPDPPPAVRQWHSRLPGSTVPAKAYRLLRAMMATAVEDELILREPVPGEGRRCGAAPERPLPTGDEVWQLADAIDDRFRALVLVAVVRRAAVGRAGRAAPTRLDLDERVVHVARQLVEDDGKLIEGPTKTTAGVRAVAIPPAVIGELERHLELYVDPAARTRRCSSVEGAPLTRSNFNRVWSGRAPQSGRPDLHLHDLRHYANTLAASAGASTES